MRHTFRNMYIRNQAHLNDTIQLVAVSLKQVTFFSDGPARIHKNRLKLRHVDERECHIWS